MPPLISVRTAWDKDLNGVFPASDRPRRWRKRLRHNYAGAIQTNLKHGRPRTALADKRRLNCSLHRGECRLPWEPADAKALPMLRTSLIFVSTALLLAGCGRGLTQVEEAAEDARISTERMIDNAEARSNAKQAEIFAMAAKMRREETESREGPRYEARKDGAGDNWMIYDNRTGAPATIGNEVMMGLTRAQVSAKLSHMVNDGDQVFRK